MAIGRFLLESAYITFPDLEGDIAEAIGTKLTIGSEIGELVLEDSSISPRHCTFIQNNGVVSLIDHSSIQGTFINRKKIEPARTFIVSEKDKIRIGNLTARIEYKKIPDSVEKIPTHNTVKTTMFEAEELKDGSEITQNYENLINKLPSIDDLKNGPSSDLDDEKSLSEGGLKLDQVEDVSLESQEKSMGVGISKLLDLNESQLEKSESQNDDEFAFSDIDVEKIYLDPGVLSYLDKKKSHLSLAQKRKRGSLNANKARHTGKKAAKVTFYENSAHVFFRFIALVFDFTILASFLNVFYSFVGVRDFMSTLNTLFIEKLFNPYLKQIWLGFEKSLPLASDISKMVTSYEQFNFVISFILLFILFRIVFTLLLGRSLGQFLIGIGANKGEIFKRIMGGVRELVSVVTSPFLVFDFPTFISKRSFKEVITGTQLYLFSRLNSIFLTIMLFPLLSYIYFLSPLYKGLTELPVISVSKISHKKDKSQWEYQNKSYSSLLGLSYDLNDELLTFPALRIETDGKRRFLTFGMGFIDLRNGNFLTIGSVTDFSLNEFYQAFIKENKLAEYFWPNIHGHAVMSKHNNKSIKKDDKLSPKVVEETYEVIKGAFQTNISNFHEFLIEHGPIFAGHRDFREKLNYVYKDPVKEIKLLNFGNHPGIFGEHTAATSNSYSFISLRSAKTKLISLSQDISSPEMALFTKQFQFIEENAAEFIKEDPISKLTLGFKNEASFENLELNQLLYENYFKAGRYTLNVKNDELKSFLIDNIQMMLAVLGERKDKNKKLFLNLVELLDALEKERFSFFNVSTTKRV